VEASFARPNHQVKARAFRLLPIVHPEPAIDHSP
jgi:hypothetical protein